MVFQRDYDQTYAPVATWGSIRLLLILTLIHSWYTVQLDYVSAFPQAPVERDLYMSVPKGFEIEGAEPGDYVFKLNRNELGFKQSNIDECVFFKEDMIYVLYTDDSILAGPDKRKIEET